MAQARFPLGLSKRRAYLLGVLLGGALGAPYAEAGSPRLSGIYPSVAQRGTEQEVILSGQLLADMRTVLFDAPGFEVSVVKAEATRCTAKIKIPADARLGEHRLRVITESGVSDLRLFFVSPFPVVEEENPKDAAGAAVRTAQRTAAKAAAKAAHAEAVAKAAAQGQPPPPAPEPLPALPEGPQLVALNTTVYGRVPSEDQDHWAVDLAAGQRLSLEVAGLQLQSGATFDPEVVVLKPDGSVLKTVGGTVFGRGNPVYSTQVPEAGRYTVTIRDVTQSAAGGVCHYFMHIGDYPRPVGVLPAGAPAGQKGEFTAVGVGAGAKMKGAVVDLGGGFGSLFPDGNIPSPIPVRISSLPNVLEKEQVPGPADTKDPVLLPAAFNGVISQKGETDYFRFTAKKSQAYHISVHARSVRSRLDSVLTVYSATGAKTGTNDDVAGPDSYLRWTAPADGEFVLGVSDQQGRGGEDFFYRVEVEPVSPKVKAYLPEIVINSSQERRAVVVPKGNRYTTMVRLKREDFPDALKLQAMHLPAGVSVSGGFVDKGGDTAVLVFEAAADAPSDQRLFSISGEPVQPPKPAETGSAADAPAQTVAAVKPQVEVEHNITTGEVGNAVAFYKVKESLLPIAVTAPVPASISINPLTESAMRGAPYPLKIKVDRKDGFKGPVEVSLLHAPAGVSTAGPVKATEEVSEVELPLSIAPTVALGKVTLAIQANLDPGSGRVWIGSNLVELEVVEAPLAGALVRSSILQGGSAVMKMKLTAKTEFEGKLKVELLGLPAGVSAESKEVDAQTSEVEFQLKATPQATLGLQKQVIAQFTLSRGGINLVATCATGGILRVDRGAPAQKTSSAAEPAPVSVAKNEPPAAPTAPASAAPTVSGDQSKAQTQSK